MKDVGLNMVTWVMLGATFELEWLPDFPRPIRGEHTADVQARIAQSGWDPATVIRVVRTPDGRHYVLKRRHALLAASAANLPPDTPVLVREQGRACLAKEAGIAHMLTAGLRPAQVLVLEGDPGCVELFAHNVNTKKPYTLLDHARLPLCPAPAAHPQAVSLTPPARSTLPRRAGSTSLVQRRVRPVSSAYWMRSRSSSSPPHRRQSGRCCLQL
jgi:hypothetical protein